VDAPATIRERIIGRAEDERPHGISFDRTHDYISLTRRLVANRVARYG
jgi:hypothetical protein